MRPDQRWFPTNRVERAAWFRNFANQFTSYAAGLDFSQDDVDAVNADNDIIQYLAKTIMAAESFKKGVVMFQETVLLGRRGAPAGHFPDPGILPPPATPPTGVFERLEKIVRRIRAASAYTPEIGALFGIIPRNPKRPDALLVKPDFKILPSSAPFSFQIRVPKRGFRAFCVYIQRQHSGEWETGGHLTVSPTVITVEPAEPGKPEVIGVRVRMVENDRAAGLYSDIAKITLIP